MTFDAEQFKENLTARLRRDRLNSQNTATKNDLLAQVNLDRQIVFVLRRKGDSNPRYPYEYDSLANCWFQPLTHLSFAQTRRCEKHLKFAFFNLFLGTTVPSIKKRCKGTAFF